MARHSGLHPGSSEYTRKPFELPVRSSATHSEVAMAHCTLSMRRFGYKQRTRHLAFSPVEAQLFHAAFGAVDARSGHQRYHKRLVHFFAAKL